MLYFNGFCYSPTIPPPHLTAHYPIHPTPPLSQSILVEPQFSSVFLNLLLGRINQLDDLLHLDAPMHRSLMAMKHAAAAGEDVSLWGIGFEVRSRLRNEWCAVCNVY
jgi:hypothetical protein